MKIILLLILLVLFFRFLIAILRLNQCQKKRIESIFCWVSYLMIILLAMFRGPHVGTDTISYIEDYESVKFLTFEEIAIDYERYIGYYYFSKLFTLMGLPCFVWFGFVELMLITSISRLFNRYSKDRLYSIVLFITTGLFMFSLAGLKQTFGLALILHAFSFFVSRKYLLTIFLLVLAFFIHPASLISLPIFMFYVLRNKKILIPIILILSAFISFSELMSVSYLVSLLGYDHYEMYLNADGSYTKSTLLLFLLLVACTLPFIKRYIQHNPMSRLEFGGAIFTCVFQFLASFSPSLFRLSFGFIPFLLIYIPNTFYETNSKLSSLLKICAVLGPIIFFIYSNRGFVYTFIAL